MLSFCMNIRRRSICITTSMVLIISMSIVVMRDRHPTAIRITIQRCVTRMPSLLMNIIRAGHGQLVNPLLW